MKNLLVLILLIGVLPSMNAQTGVLRDNNTQRTQEERNQDRETDQENRPSFRELDSINKAKKAERPPIELYKIISVENDTTQVDTSLTIQKFYKYNYLRKDRFHLLPFANTGQAHNILVQDFNNSQLRPLFGARARHVGYMQVDDINYYEVPTPLTELYYKSVFEQGQTLDAFFTMNLSKRFNFSLAYKGLRSIGKYQNNLSSTGNFRFAFNYTTKDQRYHIKAHWVAQDLSNNEFGGLQDTAIENFRSENGEFSDRSRLNVNLDDAENILDGQRFYINHGYHLLNPKDTLSSNRIRVGHILNFEDKYYRYAQPTPTPDVLGTSFKATDINDRVDLEDFNNQLFVEYSNKTLGKLTMQVNHSRYQYGYNTVLVQEDGSRIPNKLQGNIFATGASYENRIGGFAIQGEAETNFGGDFTGYSFMGSAGYSVENLGSLSASILSTSRPANYNHVLYQSSYQNYNWNNQDYKNVKINEIKFNLKSEKLFNASASITNISDQTYFAKDPSSDTLVNSFQASETINYLKLQVDREFTMGKFALNNTIAYQNVASGNDILNVPQLLTRNTLYYTDEWFDKALFIQTGINFKYFTKYNMDGYDPVLAEFYVQNDEEYGAFPLIDLFFNMKIRQTRVFVIAEHVNSSFTGNDFFSAPGYPYRDFTIRFGLVWNFFL